MDDEDDGEPSGGQDRTAAKRNREDKARGEPEYSRRAIATMNKIRRLKRAGGEGAQALSEALDLMRECMWAAATDPGARPEYRRNTAVQIGAMLVKAADPRKQIEQLGADLREAHEVILAMKGSRAIQEPEGDQAGSSPSSH